MPYATTADIEARWRTLSADERTRAEVLIQDASAMLDNLVDVDALDAERYQLLTTVTCNMVIRAMSATSLDTFGVSQTSVTAGPYTQSYSYANPSGDMYLTKFEKRLLGVSTSYIGSIAPKIEGYYD